MGGYSEEVLGFIEDLSEEGAGLEDAPEPEESFAPDDSFDPDELPEPELPESLEAPDL